jgi:ABC-2 type transport system permease protein
VQGFDFTLSAWLFGSALVWFAAAVFVFNRGLRRYTSASS